MGRELLRAVVRGEPVGLVGQQYQVGRCRPDLFGLDVRIAVRARAEHVVQAEPARTSPANVRAPTTIHGSRQMGTATRRDGCASVDGASVDGASEDRASEDRGAGPAQARSAAASQGGTSRSSGPVRTRRSDAIASGTDSITVTHTARPAARSRSTSSFRFSSRLQ